MMFSPSVLSRIGLVALAVSLSGSLAAQTSAPAASSPDKVIARVDGEPITENDVAVAGEDPALTLDGTPPEQRREILIGYVIDLKLGTKAAQAGKLDQSASFKRRLAYMRDKLLVDEYLEQQAKAGATQEAARKLYDETVRDLKPEEEVRARHILVDEEEGAKGAYARVKGGEDFAKVAAELSKDGSKTKGGDLGFFTKGRMVAPFSEAAFKLQPNEISEPVKTQFGWHVIQVLERRTKPVPSFEEMSEQIDQYLSRKAQQDAVLALRKDAKIERLDKPAGDGGAAQPAPRPSEPSSTK